MKIAQILVIVYPKFPENFLFFVEFPLNFIKFLHISTFSQSVNQIFQKFLKNFRDCSSNFLKIVLSFS